MRPRLATLLPNRCRRVFAIRGYAIDLTTHTPSRTPIPHSQTSSRIETSTIKKPERPSSASMAECWPASPVIDVLARDASSDTSMRHIVAASIKLTPSWKSLDTSHVSVVPITGGLSNKLFCCDLHDNIDDSVKPRRVVLREFCSSHGLVDRVREEKMFEFLAKQNFSPQLYGASDTYRSEQYIDGVSLTVKEIAQTPNLSLVALLLSKMHSMTPSPSAGIGSASTPELFTYIDTLCSQASVSRASPELLARLSCAHKTFTSIVKPHLISLNAPVVLCHNDAQEGNVLRLTNGSHMLIDYEYSAFSYRGFDLANTVCEASLDNAAPNESGFQVRHDLTPSHSAKRAMATSYLTGMNIETSNAAIDQLVLEVDSFKAASHLQWAAWAIAKSGSVDIVFGYIEYAEARLQLFEQELRTTYAGRLEEINRKQC